MKLCTKSRVYMKNIDEMNLKRSSFFDKLIVFIEKFFDRIKEK